MKIFGIITLALMSLALTPTTSHSSLATTATKDKTAIQFKVKVVPSKDLVMNYEGPWRLKVLEAKGLKDTPKAPLGLKDFNQKTEEFAFTAAPIGQTKGEVKVEVTAFVCAVNPKTHEKTECFRDVHTQTIPWTN